jgi:hypothetical protein
MKIVLYDYNGVQQDEIDISRTWVAEEAMDAARKVVRTAP